MVFLVAFLYYNFNFAKAGAEQKFEKGNDVYKHFCGKYVGTFCDYYSTLFCYMSFFVMVGEMCIRDSRIMPEEEFLFLVQISDQFEVVKLEKNFVEKYKGQFAANPIITEDISSQIEDGVELSEIEGYVNDEHAEGLYFNHELVGCVKRAHDIDQNLSCLLYTSRCV